jgi:RNA ligase
LALGSKTISTVYGRHPARVMAYDELRAGLLDAERACNVVAAREEGLEVYTYTNGCRFENRWDLFSLLARGLILDPQAGQVVATPFPKFFNYGELIPSLPDEPFEVTEKIDGSLGILFHHGGRWRIATKGRLTSEQAVWANGFLSRRVDTRAFSPGTTYLLEIVYLQNRIVIPYSFEGLVLLGAYGEDGHELTRPQLLEVAERAGLQLVESHTYSTIDELLMTARGLPRTREGFVVRFRSGLRIKLKGEEYCRIHRLVCYCTPLTLWEAMMNGDDLDALRRELPEEMTRDFDTIRRLLQAQLDALVADLQSACDTTAHLTDKDLGLRLGTDPAFSPAARKLLFMCRKARFFEHVHQPGDSRRKAFQFFRPVGNRLPGYVPSDAMNRFQSEST